MTYEEKLTQLMQENDNLFVLTAENRGPIIYIQEKFQKRFIDTGITEQSLIGIAAGLALTGNIPIVHSLAAFLTMRAFEFIRIDIGLAGMPVKMIGTISGILSEANGPTHQAIQDIALMRAIPNLNIFCPADEQEMVSALPEIISDINPWYIRYNDTTANFNHSNFKIGKAEVIGEGKDLSIFTYGFMFNEAIKLFNTCLEAGIGVRLVNMRCLEPFDKDVILECLLNCSRIIVIEDHLIWGGLYTIIAETALKSSIKCEILPFSFHNYFKPGKINEILFYENVSAENIWERIKKIKEIEVN